MSEWVSVKDRLPDVDAPILFYGMADTFEPVEILLGWYGYQYHNPSCGDLDFQAANWCQGMYECENPRPRDVTHWMPLPEPPLDARKEEK